MLATVFKRQRGFRLSIDIGVKCIGQIYLTLYSKITPLRYHVFENIMENDLFAAKEQKLHFPKYFQKYSKRSLNFRINFVQCCLKIENDVMI